MRLAFALYKYFPFGGLARDFMRVAKVCQQRGHQIDVYVMEWQGDQVPGYKIHVLPSKGWSNHTRVAHFHRQLKERLSAEEYDAVVGFNKIPGVDVYYAADPCFVERFEAKSFLHKLNPRFRFFSAFEEAIFGLKSSTLCLMISDVQAALFTKHYQTPVERLLALPPGIDPSRRKPLDADLQRRQFRLDQGFKDDDRVVLMVGSAFKTKGVDRAIKAFSLLPAEILENSYLLIVGEGNVEQYDRLAADKAVKARVRFMGGRDDIPLFLLGSDLLLHPARKENTGTVILEAMVAGLPMLVTDVCGYAKHVIKSKSGKVLASPFSVEALAKELENMLTSERGAWIESALSYADNEDLYSMPEKAVVAIETVAKRNKNVI